MNDSCNSLIIKKIRDKYKNISKFKICKDKMLKCKFGDFCAKGFKCTYCHTNELQVASTKKEFYDFIKSENLFQTIKKYNKVAEYIFDYCDNNLRSSEYLNKKTLDFREKLIDHCSKEDLDWLTDITEEYFRRRVFCYRHFKSQFNTDESTRCTGGINCCFGNHNLQFITDVEKNKIIINDSDTTDRELNCKTTLIKHQENEEIHNVLNILEKKVTSELKKYHEGIQIAKRKNNVLMKDIIDGYIYECKSLKKDINELKVIYFRSKNVSQISLVEFESNEDYKIDDIERSNSDNSYKKESSKLRKRFLSSNDLKNYGESKGKSYVEELFGKDSVNFDFGDEDQLNFFDDSILEIFADNTELDFDYESALDSVFIEKNREIVSPATSTWIKNFRSSKTPEFRNTSLSPFSEALKNEIDLF